ncbi:unnamed protein product [Sphenostylis stenocarpa]|uniref:UBC core domain-containing protein n=1 Tax=Sphenostylis stenocarpa TaxID=92480 RepID=A0AA86S3C9_9FABA|nr:unnamed protein product [Sphenostylis stenocarpa]
MGSFSVEKQRSKQPMERKTTKGFERFDVVTDDRDHRFRDSNDGKSFNDGSSELYKTIMREWKILEKNLPESIYVRVYEQRIDLMRAVIVGAVGTPYHDGIFFFDIVFPANYPKHPPKLYYHSFGYRLNPNLYNNGKVCLSLLNTWHGRKREKWDPSESTMLQVLLSIQALVLNEKPFFNEPGVDKGLGRFGLSLEKKSRVYNEGAYFTTCRTSYQLLRRPPRNFEEFVSGHFRERASRIIDAGRQYASGHVRIGYYSCESAPSSSSGVVVSPEFKVRIKEFFPLFVRALRQNENGAPVDGVDLRCTTNFVVTAWNDTDGDWMEDPENKGGGFFKTMMDKIKQSFGWKNIGNNNSS